MQKIKHRSGRKKISLKSFTAIQSAIETNKEASKRFSLRRRRGGLWLAERESVFAGNIGWQNLSGRALCIERSKKVVYKSGAFS